MPKISRLAVLAVLGAVFASPVYADNKPAEAKPAATVNGVAIPQLREDLRLKVAQAQGQPDSPELRKAIRDDLINLELMSQESLKKGLDKQPEIAQQLELARETVLVGAFVQDYVKAHPVSDEAIAKEYDDLKSGLGSKEYNVSHILVDNEGEAKSIVAKLKKGASFEKLAKEHSKDAGSKEHGGELGWIPVGNIPRTFVKPFGDALLKLGKGEVSAPVHSQFGWHVIKLDDVRDLKLPPQEDVKKQLTQRLQQQAVKQLIAELRSKAKIE